MNSRLNLSLLAVIALLIGCKATRSSMISYAVEAHSNDSISGRRFLFKNCLISFNDYLFEFKMRQNLPDKPMANQYNDGITLDTIGVYLIAPATQQYYEFDSFALQAKLLRKGLVSERANGLRLTKTGGVVSDMHYGAMKEIKSHKFTSFSAEVLSNHPETADDSQVQVLLIKQPGLNSHYKMMGAKFVDSNYCIVGMSVAYPAHKTYFTQKVVEFRSLNKGEVDICKSLIKSAQAIN